MPSIATQKKIASVFNALDDKIALNNKINDNLEQQAQTLYRKYFSEAGNTGELADVCDFSKDKIAVSELSVGNYFSTENMLPDKKGAIEATNLPAVQQTTACHRGNVLVSNIRPYFKRFYIASVKADAQMMSCASCLKRQNCQHICIARSMQITFSTLWWRVQREQRCPVAIKNRS